MKETKGKKTEGEEKGSSSPSSALVLSNSSPLDLSLSLPLRPPPPPLPRLTDSQGRALPPVPRHAFALSRVHYSSKDQSSRSVDSWLDSPRLRLRWRQTAGEVSVIVASVGAAGLSAAEIEVVISPRRLVVSSRRRKRDGEAKATTEKTGVKTQKEAEIFLDLALERMVVPDESTWTLLTPRGLGEEGLLVTLTKANVELFAAAAASGKSSVPSPSLTWWPRLAERVNFPLGDGESDLSDETAVAWDDYEKDYSDLPRFAAEKVNAAEAALRLQDSSAGSGSAGGGSGSSGGSGTFSGVLAGGGLDRALRRSLACADDSRRRHRVERLREMRREVISRGEEAGRKLKKREGKEEGSL